MRDTLHTATIRLGVVVCLLLPMTSADAQARQFEPVVRSWTDPSMATILLVDSLDAPNARAVAIRRPGDLPNNIILVTRKTTPPELARAVAAIIASRRNRGDRVGREMRTIITAVDSKKHKPTRDDARAKADLHRLAYAPEFAIRGIGRGPSVVIRMPESVTAKARTP